MNAWTETLAENESDHAYTMQNEACPCGVRLGDHYDRDGDWVSCLDAAESE